MIAATDHTSAFVSAAQAARALQPPRWLTLLAAVVLLLIGLSYHVKGQYLLVYGEHRSDAIDLRQKWTEQQYFLQRQNPFDVWIRYGPLAKTRTEPFRHATRNDTIDPRLGLRDPAHPPFGFVSALPFFWPDWPAVRVWWAALNVLATLVILAYAFHIGARYGPEVGLLFAAAVLAIGGAATTLEVGQYGLVVMAFLAGAAWAGERDTTGRQILMGLLVGIALVKITISIPFVVALVVSALVVRRRWIAVATMCTYCLIGSLIAWAVVSTNPLEMLMQLKAMGAYLAEGGTLGIAHGLASLGLSPDRINLISAAIVMIPAVAIMWMLRDRPLLELFAIAAVAGRLWTYHRSYDDVMLIFLILAALRILFELGWKHLPALAVAALVIASVFVPGRVLGVPAFQLVQIFVWVIGAVWLLIAAPLTPSGESSAGLA
jgi:hypothetical protein